jgi:predicted transcriptional regulator
VEREELVTLTADIVAAHVANNSVAISDIGTLVERVFGALAGLGAAEAPPEPAARPAVSVRSSVKPDHLVCLECGRKQKTLKRHLMTAHGMTPQEYRERFGLAPTYPMVSSVYSEQRRAMAKSLGLGRLRTPGGSRAAGGRKPSAPGGARRKQGRTAKP